jgi:hypothetical protein
VGRLGDELVRLRQQLEAHEPHHIPPEVGVLLALHHRSQARRDGKSAPPFRDAQVKELYRQDLKHIGPEMERWRTTPGWTDEESQYLLDEWEEGARARLTKIDEGASLSEVYEECDVDEEEDVE